MRYRMQIKPRIALCAQKKYTEHITRSVSTNLSWKNGGKTQLIAQEWSVAFINDGIVNADPRQEGDNWKIMKMVVMAAVVLIFPGDGAGYLMADNSGSGGTIEDLISFNK